MQKELSPKEAPFFNLLAEADEVQIREIAKQQDGMEDAQSIGIRPGYRSFVVRIKATAEAAKEPSKQPHLLENRSVEEIRASAKLLLSNGDFVLARNLYSFLLDQNIRNEEALNGLAQCLFHLGETASARKCFKALAEHHKRPAGWLGMGKCFSKENDSSQALQCLSKIEAPETLLEQDRVDFYRCRGTCLARTGESGLAETAFLEALTIQPMHDGILVNLGSLYLQRKAFEKAHSAFKKAATHNPASARAHCGLGLTAAAQANLTLAGTYFHKALDFESGNSIAMEELVRVSLRVRETRRVKMRLLAYLDKHPRSADANVWLGQVLLQEGSTVRAALHFDRALQFDSKHSLGMQLRQKASDILNSNQGGIE